MCALNVCVREDEAKEQESSSCKIQFSVLAWGCALWDTSQLRATQAEQSWANLQTQSSAPKGCDYQGSTTASCMQLCQFSMNARQFLVHWM